MYLSVPFKGWRAMKNGNLEAHTLERIYPECLVSFNGRMIRGTYELGFGMFRIPLFLLFHVGSICTSSRYIISLKNRPVKNRAAATPLLVKELLASLSLQFLARTTLESTIVWSPHNIKRGFHLSPLVKSYSSNGFVI